MATVTKPQQAKPVRPAVQPALKTKAVKTRPQREQVFLFDKTNYLLMAGGIALIFIGFLLMSGGKSPDPHQFLYNEIYSVRRITVAPIIIFLGFAIEIYAIMRVPKEESKPQNTV